MVVKMSVVEQEIIKRTDTLLWHLLNGVKKATLELKYDSVRVSQAEDRCRLITAPRCARG